ncbi:MAG: DUF3810 domain-containing protein [Flavisolibacter sp.]
MLQSLLRDRKLLILLLLAILIKVFSLNAGWVERYYTYGFYPFISKILRAVLGWIPFSVGDILYISAFIFFVAKAWKLIRLLAKRQVKEYLSWILFRKYLRLVLWIYIVFNLGWGLNYDRQGIAHQLGLQVAVYSNQELFKLTSVLAQRLNYYASLQDTVKRLELDKNRTLFEQAKKDYEKAKGKYPFLAYSFPSVKPSIFSGAGHYFGFSGYLNPFTGEAQINTDEPVFTKPFVINHEIGHQLGYGKEYEASFVSFLACKNSDNMDFRYSLYYELFFNALHECMMTRDTSFISLLKKNLHPRVRNDKLAEIQFRTRRKNNMQPYVSEFYNNYLKMNNQPEGLRSYDEVIAWLVAFMKKYGEEEL